MLAADVERQVAELRQSLDRAKAKILEQQDVINTLTSPPFLYATVVAVSDGTPRPEKKAYVGIDDQEMYVDPHVYTRGVYAIGDILLLRKIGVDLSKLPDAVRGGRKFTVVGFYKENPDDVVIQIDDRRVCLVEHGGVSFYFEVVRKKQDYKGTAVIVSENKIFEVFLPKDKKVNPGDTVSVNQQSLQIINVAAVQVAGNIGFIRRIIDDTFSEVDCEAGTRVVFNGRFSGYLEKGNRVVLDGSSIVIVRDLGKDDERFRFEQETGVSWQDIGGLVEAKRQLVEAIELPYQNRELFDFYKKRPIKGVLLYGPPGCGKTMLGKATATALARVHTGVGRSTGFIYIKGPEILERFVGVAEATIRQIFAKAREHKKVHGYPAVIFLDEAEGILAKRGTGVSSDIERTIVPMFLAEMDGLEDTGALIMIATNRPDILDPAIVRDGRIDRKVKVDRPNREDAAHIFTLGLSGVPLHNGYTHADLAQVGSDEIFSDQRILYTIETKHNGTCNFTLKHIINGGMIIGIIDQATSIAMRRDIADGKSQGIRREDIIAAVDAVERQNRDLNLTDEIAEFVHDFHGDVMSIRKLRQGTA